MKKIAASGLLMGLAGVAVLLGSGNFARPQHAGMRMAKNTLLLAQLDAAQVVGGSTSGATGTGAFLLDPVQHALEYHLTYQGLDSSRARTIALHNFDRGRNGEIVKVLCGEGAAPCPEGAGATVAGNFERGGGRALDNNLIGEFASGRIYVEVTGGDGRPEIRGQLNANSAMVPVANFVAHLTPIEGTESKGSGTAVVSETYLPGGQVSVFYAETVAGTAGPPTNAGLFARNAPRDFKQLPQFTLLPSKNRETGGSLSGSYQVKDDAPDALFASRLARSGNGEPGLVVTTSRHPQGELAGALIAVQ